MVFLLSTRKNRKQAQISTYFILVVILVLMIIAYFFIKKTLVYDVQPYPVINPSFRPVQELVDTCLQRVGKQGIELMARQGGYIELPKRITFEKDAHLEVVPNGQLLVPYWYYRGMSYHPTLESMERQLSDYIVENLPSCIDFTPLEPQYNITEGDRWVETKILENKVAIILHYPLHVVKYESQETKDFETFPMVFDARLKRLYDLALAIHDTEAKTTFLENMTLDLLTINPAIPFTGLLFDCQQHRWRIPEIIKEIKETLYVNVPSLRIENTNMQPFAPDQQYEQLHMLWKVTDADYSDIRVGSEFRMDWPFGFRVRPREGDTMYARKGKAFLDYLTNFCVQTYHFTYDISYPVLFTLRDRQSFNGEGLTFQFAEPVIINHNKAERERYTISDFIVPFYQEDFCEEKTQEKYRIYVFDKRTGFSLEGANITHVCANRYCPLGSTQFNGEEYLLEAAFPKNCIGGMIKATAPGYLEGNIAVPLENVPVSFAVDLLPLYQLNYTVYKHTFDNPYLKKGLAENEEVIIQLSNPSLATKTIVQFPNTVNLTLELIGNDTFYNVTAYLVRDNKVVGGYRGLFNYTYDMIADAAAVAFHVVDFNDEVILENITSFNFTAYHPEFIKYNWFENNQESSLP